jgi:hypothetical protein
MNDKQVSIKMARKCRLEIMTLIDTILEAQEVPFIGYMKFFRSASPELKTYIDKYSRIFPAWDILTMCLNHVGYTGHDYDLLIGVSHIFMNDVRSSKLNG